MISQSLARSLTRVQVRAKVVHQRPVHERAARLHICRHRPLPVRPIYTHGVLYREGCVGAYIQAPL